MWVTTIRRVAASGVPNSRVGGAVSTHKLNKIEFVPERLHRYLFEKDELGREARRLKSIPPAGGLIKNDVKSINELVNSLELPELRVYGDLMAHFQQLGREQFQSYGALLELALNIQRVPPLPEQWSLEPGWTAYDSLTGERIGVRFPDENVLFFDVEVCVRDGQLPTLAVALSPTKWYSWYSNRLVNLSEYPTLARPHHLIPLEADDESRRQAAKIVIGHNVAYDRSRVREQYYPKKSGARFWDTMSMSIAICGMADHQRLLFERSDSTLPKRGEEWLDEWRLNVCKNSLEAIHSKFCSDTSKLSLKKEFQDVFVKEDIQAIRENFQVLTTYCATDVHATLEVFRALYPLFRDRFPSAITSCGMLEMASAYLPINANWRHFYDNCVTEAATVRDLAAKKILQSAETLVKELEEDANDIMKSDALTSAQKKPVKKYELDPWLWVADWRRARGATLPAWFNNYFKTKKDADQYLADPSTLAAGQLRMMNRDMPRMFGLCYGPYPLFFKLEHGWGFLVPRKDLTYNLSEGSGANKCPDFEVVRLKRGDEVILPNRKILEMIECNRCSGVNEVILRSRAVGNVGGVFEFYKLPHTSGSASDNVGSPFSKNYRESFEQGQLRALRFPDVLKAFLESQSITRFWGNYRERYQEQLAVWLDEQGQVGAIAPSIIPSGTVTRRAVHKLWLVSTNAKEGTIGSDLKSMVQCSDGWNLVGADVDSQEQWLAALFGDSALGLGRAGSTAFSNMLLAGDKSNGTDLHSVVAREAKVTRDHAKTLNYARLYGAGQPHAIEFLKQKGVPAKSAIAISEKLFSTTKGVTAKYHELNSALRADFERFLAEDCPPAYRQQAMLLDNRYFLPVYDKLRGDLSELSRLFEKCMLRRIRASEDTAMSKQIVDAKDLFTHLYRDYPHELELFRGGFESHTFNFLELKSRERQPKTPILECRLSRALEPLSGINSPNAMSFSQRYKRSVINWFVQSSAVDFLHMLLVCMTWLCNEYDIEARFVLSIHDEIRYLVREEDRYRCALALLMSNMFVRSAISSKLGINELPMSIAFFSQVDIDKVLRKEVNMACRSPNGSPIPSGEGLRVADIISRTGGSLLRRPVDGDNCGNDSSSDDFSKSSNSSDDWTDEESTNNGKVEETEENFFLEHLKFGGVLN